MAAAKDHKEFVKAHKAHDETSGGCLIYCTSKYEDKPHAHRWHAARRAEGEKRVPWADAEDKRPIFRPKSRMQELKDEGALASRPQTTKQRGTHSATAKWWYTDERPFWHNAHHIIPSEALEKAIGKVIEKAAPREGKMQELIVGGLLDEPYNHNDKPNVMVLPMATPESEILGLPKHLDDSGGKNHRDYTRGVLTNVNLRFQRAYSSLASDVAQQEHVSKKDMPAMKDSLVSLSNSVYEAIIQLSVANRAAGKSIDKLIGAIMRLAKKLRSR